VALNDTDTVPVNRPVQVRDLFSMTSGSVIRGETSAAERAAAVLFSEFEQETAGGNPPGTVAVANRMGAFAVAVPAGRKVAVGTSADVLGAVVEVASGMPLDEYMAKTVFVPLGMEDTGFFVPEEKRERLVTLYERKDAILSPYPDGHLGPTPVRSGRRTSPAALARYPPSTTC
jgi:CubicO group peptidase (beta-lactamase class C family)